MGDVLYEQGIKSDTAHKNVAMISIAIPANVPARSQQSETQESEPYKSPLRKRGSYDTTFHESADRDSRLCAVTDNPAEPSEPQSSVLASYDPLIRGLTSSGSKSNKLTSDKSESGGPVPGASEVCEHDSRHPQHSASAYCDVDGSHAKQSAKRWLSNCGLTTTMKSVIHEAQSLGMCFHTTERPMRQRMDRMADRGEVVKPFRGMYADPTWWNGLNPLQKHICIVRTLAQLHPDWVFCGTSAAAIWGFSPPYHAMNDVHVARLSGSRYRNADGLQFHGMKNSRITSVNGVLVTMPERTTADCARTLSLAECIAVADAATRALAWDTFHIARYLNSDRVGRSCGLARARQAALLIDARSENGGESVARASMICEGIQLPELQVEVPCVGGGAPYRVDFFWPGQGSKAPIYGELDGRIKYTDQSMLGGGDSIDALLKERRRESELTLLSGSIVRFSWEEAKRPERLSRRLRQFGVPCACDALSFTNDERHNYSEICRYLAANEHNSASARARLDFLREIRESGC